MIIFMWKFLGHMHKYNNNPEKLVTSKVNKHKACGCSLFTLSSVDSNKCKHDFYWGDDFIKTLCRDLRKHITEIIYCEKKKCYN